MENLPERRFLSSLIKKKNAGPADLSLAAVQLANIHADSGMSVREGEQIDLKKEDSENFISVM